MKLYCWSLVILMFPSFCDNHEIRNRTSKKLPKFGCRFQHNSPMKIGSGSTARKDRHSKVFTAKGPRDRRLRLSAHTAIRFYDLQDRLGYDRPSKAVDWLINKAKFAIDNLAELPPYYPLANHPSSKTDSASQLQMQSSATTSINFQGYPVDLILRPADPAANLRLSLHSFHDSRLEDTSPSPADSIPADDAGLWLQQPLLGQSSEAAAAFSQRRPLQSSLGHSVPIRGWSYQRTHPNQPSSFPGGRFDGSLEFGTPSLIGGEGREDGVVSGSHSSSPNYRP